MCSDLAIDLYNVFFFWLHNILRESKILQRVKCVGNLFVGILQDVTKWKEWNRMKTKNHRIVPKHIFVPVLSLKNRNNLIPNWFILYCKLESGIYQIRSSRTKLNTFQCLNMSAILSGLRYKDTQYLFKQGCLNFFF